MARYRKIDPRMWNDARFSALSTEAKLLFVYLLTAPAMTMLGALPLRASAVAEELGLDSKRYAIRYAELFDVGMVEYDDRGLFWVKNFLKYNAPDNPKVVVSWGAALDLLPECPLLQKILESAESHCQQRGKGFVESFQKAIGERMGYGMADGISYPMPYQEQEQEQEQEYKESTDVDSRRLQEKPTLDLASEIPTRAPSIPYQKIVDTYNRVLGKSLGVCKVLSNERRKVLGQRWRQIQEIIESTEVDATLEGFDAFYQKVSRSDFLMGKSPHGKPTLTGFISPQTSTRFTKEITTMADKSRALIHGFQ